MWSKRFQSFLHNLIIVITYCFSSPKRRVVRPNLVVKNWFLLCSPKWKVAPVLSNGMIARLTCGGAGGWGRARTSSYPEKNPIPMGKEHSLKSPPRTFARDNHEFPALTGHSFPFDISEKEDKGLIVSLDSFIQAYLICSHFALLCFPDVAFFYKREVFGDPALSTSVGIIFPTAFLTLCLRVAFGGFSQYFTLFHNDCVCFGYLWSVIFGVTIVTVLGRSELNPYMTVNLMD